MTRDDLIEKAAKAIYDHSETNELGDVCQCGTETGNDLAKHQAEIVLAVFEESLAPTGDDREAHDHKSEPMVWCETHQHEHIARMPRFTYLCKDCGWGQWYGDDAREHEFWTQENLREAHTTYEVEHVTRPLAAEPKPPVYLAADLWDALGAPTSEFDAYYDRNGWADTWSNLLGAVRDHFKPKCGLDVDGEPCVLSAGHLPPHYGPSDVGSSEPVPVAEPHGEPSSAVPEPSAETEDEIHTRGATSFDCERCGQDPEDCYCGDEPQGEPEPSAEYAKVWDAAFFKGWLDRHVARPDEDGNFGPTLPIPNPYGKVQHSMACDACGTLTFDSARFGTAHEVKADGRVCSGMFTTPREDVEPQGEPSDAELEHMRCALNAADIEYSAREQRANAGGGEMEPGDWLTFLARAALRAAAAVRGTGGEQ